MRFCGILPRGITSLFWTYNSFNNFLSLEIILEMVSGLNFCNSSREGKSLERTIIKITTPINTVNKKRKVFKNTLKNGVDFFLWGNLGVRFGH